jgi:hypothetical protein
LQVTRGYRKPNDFALSKRTVHTGEFVHTNVVYSMEIDAKVRRLVVGAALGNAG